MMKTGCKAVHSYLLQFETCNEAGCSALLVHIKWCGIPPTDSPYSVSSGCASDVTWRLWSSRLGLHLTIASKTFNLSTMYKDIVEYVTTCQRCQVMKGHYTGLHIKQGSSVANNPWTSCALISQRSTHLRLVKKMFQFWFMHFPNSARPSLPTIRRLLSLQKS